MACWRLSAVTDRLWTLPDGGFESLFRRLLGPPCGNAPGRNISGDSFGPMLISVATYMVKHLGSSQQIATKTHARQIQTGIRFGCVLFFAGLAANVAADGAGGRLEFVSRYARGPPGQCCLAADL